MVRSIVKHKPNVVEKELFPKNVETHYIELKYAKRTVFKYFEKTQVLMDLVEEFEGNTLLDRSPLIREYYGSEIMQFIPRNTKFIDMDAFLLGCMSVYKELRKSVVQFVKDLFDCSDLAKKDALTEDEFVCLIRSIDSD